MRDYDAVLVSFTLDGKVDTLILTKEQVRRLGDIVDDDQEFIESTHHLISYARIFAQIPHQMLARVNKDLDRIQKAFEVASPEALSLFDTQGIRLSSNYELDSELSPHETAYSAASPVIVDDDELNTLRLNIGRRARQIFKEFGYHIGTSKTGEFTNYLRFISEVSGIEYDAHKLARDIQRY